MLYIADDIVAPRLHLIRRVCNPESNTRPHVTVRYPIDKLQDHDLAEYENRTIDKVDIVEPGAFGLQDANTTETRTVFVKCSSDLLQELSYKPYYPDSIFHITLYDGRSLRFARQLLQILRRFAWGFTVALPKHTKLTRIQVGRHERNHRTDDRVYVNKLKLLFYTITSERLSSTFLARLTNTQRLEFTEAICANLHNSTARFPKIAPRSSLTDEKSRKDSLQIAGRESNYYSLASSKRLADDFRLLTRNQPLYLTPPELARDIIQYAVSQLSPDIGGVDFGDPAVGTGVFYSALLGILTKDRINSAIGIDIDANRVDETRKRWSHRGLVVQTGDYLHMDKLPPRNLIVANPPYMRYQRVPTAYRQKLQELASVQMGMRISGQSSLYVYFMLISHGWMKREAVAAWLIPSEFMETNYGAVVRKYLTERVELIRIHRFTPGRPQFENALVTSAVIVFRNCPPRLDQTVTLSMGANLLNPEHVEQITLAELIQESKWSFPWIRHRISLSKTPSIGHLFTVRRGIATGANAFFIMERNVAAQRGIPEAALRPLLPKARNLESDVIEREQDGYPRVFPQLCLLDCELSMEEIGTMYPRLLDYLKTAPEDTLQSALVRSRQPWYRQEQRQPPPFLCTYMGRGSRSRVPLRFLWNKSDAIATNTYLMLYPREALRSLLNKQPDAFETVFALLKEVNSQDLLRNGRVYGGGLHKIEPKELLNVRLPSFPPWLETVVQEDLPLS